MKSEGGREGEERGRRGGYMVKEEEVEKKEYKRNFSISGRVSLEVL
jgi:hypothetical protein